MSKERVIIDPATGGRKGQKPERFELLPWDSVKVIARVYDYGATKYSDPIVGPHNWRRGYAWGLSFAALLRHLTAWWEGEDIDPESGHPHLAHAGWHVLTLIWFTLTGKGTDDRPHKLAKEPWNVEKTIQVLDKVLAEKRKSAGK